MTPNELKSAREVLKTASQIGDAIEACDKWRAALVARPTEPGQAEHFSIRFGQELGLSIYVPGNLPDHAKHRLQQMLVDVVRDAGARYCSQAESYLLQLLDRFSIETTGTPSLEPSAT